MNGPQRPVPVSVLGLFFSGAGAAFQWSWGQALRPLLSPGTRSGVAVGALQGRELSGYSQKSWV